jgi:hypothetical protein
MKRLPGNKILGSVLVILILSCTPAGKISVTHVNDTGSLRAGSFIYALPLTVVDIKVNAEEVTVVPGPYYKFADKYLGIKNAPEKSGRVWHILELQLFSHTEADPDYIYTVQGVNGSDANTSIARLFSDSLILNAKDFSHNQIKDYRFPPKMDEIAFTDLSIKRNFEAEKDINISLVMPGADDEKRSPGKSLLKEKTVEQKAEEAANFLIKLKKRRFKLVAGQYDSMPQGEALADALQELARLEETYLSLFIGKKIVTHYQRNYHFTPVAGKETDRIVIFRFSENEGFVDAREASGVPVVIDLYDNNKTKALEQYGLPVKPQPNLLHYRVADQVSVKLIAGEQVWSEASFPVFQYGAIVPMNLER